MFLRRILCETDSCATIYAYECCRLQLLSNQVSPEVHLNASPVTGKKSMHDTFPDFLQTEWRHYISKAVNHAASARQMLRAVTLWVLSSAQTVHYTGHHTTSQTQYQWS